MTLGTEALKARQEARVFPYAVVEALVVRPDEDPPSVREIARRLDNVVSYATIRRMRELELLTFEEADLLAIRGLHLHPLHVWGDEWVAAAFEASQKGLG